MVDFDERSHIADLEVGSNHAHHEPGHHWEQRLTGVAAEAIEDVAADNTSSAIDSLLSQYQDGGGEGATVVASEGVSSEVRGAAVRETLQRYGASTAGTSLANEGLQAWLKERAPVQSATVTRAPEPEQKKEKQEEPVGLAEADPLAEGLGNGLEQDQSIDQPQGIQQGLEEPLGVADGLPAGIEMDIREGMPEGISSPLSESMADGMQEPLAMAEDQSQDQAMRGLQGMPAGIEARIREGIDIEEPIATQQEQPLADIETIPTGIEMDLREGIGKGLAEPLGAAGLAAGLEQDTETTTDTRIGQQTALDQGAQIQPGVESAISQELPPGVEFEGREAIGIELDNDRGPLTQPGTDISQSLPSGVTADIRTREDLELGADTGVAPESLVELPKKYQDLPPGMTRFFREKLEKERLELSA